MVSPTLELKVRLVQCNDDYNVLEISITRNTIGCNGMTIIIYLFGDNT